MASRVNKNLREQIEMQNNTDVTYAFRSQNQKDEVAMFSYLASNKTQTDAFLNEIWNRFGKFADNDGNVFGTAQSIRETIKYELLDKLTFKKECKVSDDCWPIVERIMRSVLALSLVASQPPNSPGQYLTYHIERILGEDSYLSQSTDWLYSTFEEKPDDLTLELNKYFINVTHELSNGKLSDVSILDVPGFGSMFHSFKKPCEKSPWSLQLNMAIYNQLMKMSNFTWSEAWNWDLFYDCSGLVYQWGEYMKDQESNPFPPSEINNTFFNYTKYIEEDMTTFLESQAISSQNTNASYWSNIATKEFSETNSESYVEENGYYDRLIMDCVFKGPLASHEPNLSKGCGDFYNKLTSNGLCQSFNGIEASQLWKENERKSEILQTFSRVFSESQQNTEQFRGIGHSEGMQK